MMLDKSILPNSLAASDYSFHPGIPQSSTWTLSMLFLSSTTQRCCWRALPGDSEHGLSPREGCVTKPHYTCHSSSRWLTARMATAHPAWAFLIPCSLLPSGGCLILFRRLKNPSVVWPLAVGSLVFGHLGNLMGAWNHGIFVVFSLFTEISWLWTPQRAGKATQESLQDLSLVSKPVVWIKTYLRDWHYLWLH